MQQYKEDRSNIIHNIIATCVAIICEGFQETVQDTETLTTTQETLYCLPNKVCMQVMFFKHKAGWEHYIEHSNTDLKLLTLFTCRNSSVVQLVRNGRVRRTSVVQARVAEVGARSG